MIACLFGTHQYALSSNTPPKEATIASIMTMPTDEEIVISIVTMALTVPMLSVGTRSVITVINLGFASPRPRPWTTSTATRTYIGASLSSAMNANRETRMQMLPPRIPRAGWARRSGGINFGESAITLMLAGRTKRMSPMVEVGSDMMFRKRKGVTLRAQAYTLYPRVHSSRVERTCVDEPRMNVHTGWSTPSVQQETNSRAGERLAHIKHEKA